MNILVLHGPNLNLLGEREPEIYGTTTLSEINAEIDRLAGQAGHDLRIYQSNHEGELIDHIHENRAWMDVLIMNPGALTHYGYALRDAVSGVNKPMIEVHLSDLRTREAFRQVNVFAGLPQVTRIMGKGISGYYEAVERCATLS